METVLEIGPGLSCFSVFNVLFFPIAFRIVDMLCLSKSKPDEFWKSEPHRTIVWVWAWSTLMAISILLRSPYSGFGGSAERARAEAISSLKSQEYSIVCATQIYLLVGTIALWIGNFATFARMP